MEKLMMGPSDLPGPLSKAIKVWSGSVPAWLFRGAWGICIFGYLLFAARFAFVGLNFHGLPSQTGSLLFWALGAISFAVGWFQSDRAGLIYLVAFPIVLTVNGLPLLPFTQIPVYILNYLVAAWLLRLLIPGRGGRVEFFSQCRWADFLVGCFGAAAFLSTIYGLAQPSWRNSLSIAFSIFGWNWITDEFEGLWMGHNILSGILYYVVLRHSIEKSGFRAAHKALLLQILCVLTAWLSYLIYWKIAGRQESNSVNCFPFLIKHDAAAYGLLAFGYLLGISLFSNARRGATALFGSLGFLLCCFTFFTGSKAAWAIILCLVPGALLAWNVKKGLLLCLLFSAGVFGLARMATSGSFQNSVASEVNQINPEIAGNVNLTYRLQMYEDAIRLWAAHPLAGTGVGTFGPLAAHMRSGIPPDGAPRNFWVSSFDYHEFSYFFSHNTYLDILQSMGLPSAGVYVCCLIFLLFISAYRVFDRNPPEINMGAGLFFALAGFGLFSLFDSRLCQFNSAVPFWTFAAFGVAMTVSSKNADSKVSALWLWPVLAPLAILLAAPIQLAGGSLSRNRDYGTWNFRMKDGEGSLLLAKEARIFIPASDGVTALAFRLPKDAAKEMMEIQIAINGAQPQKLAVRKSDETFIPLDVAPDGGGLTQVTVVCEAWCGRGALGSPLGVKPYALAMRKIQAPTDSKSRPE
jgi:O-antigen ligase